MDLNRNQWHVQLFFWCLDVWDAFRDSHTDRQKSNLCHYIRTIFVWMPLVLACQVGLLAYAGYVLIWYPVTRFGWVWYGRGLLAIAIIVGAIYAFRYFMWWLELRRLRATVRNEPLRTVSSGGVSTSTDEETEDRGPGLIQLIFEWLVARKRQICPIISFTNSNHEFKEAA